MHMQIDKTRKYITARCIDAFIRSITLQGFAHLLHFTILYPYIKNFIQSCGRIDHMPLPNQNSHTRTSLYIDVCLFI